MAASINIHVTNVTCHIQLIAVIFDPHRLPVLKAPLPGPELPTPVQIERFLPLLHGYDVELVHALYNGFKFGLPIHSQGPRVSLYAKNLASIGMSWEGKFYYDKAMPICCSSSCRTFEILQVWSPGLTVIWYQRSILSDLSKKILYLSSVNKMKRFVSSMMKTPFSRQYYCL